MPKQGCGHFDSSTVDVIVNIHELLLLPGTLESLLSIHCLPKVCSASHTRQHPKKPPQETQKSGSSKPGRPSIVDKFPAIVEVASEFVKSHGYAAHVRRRESVASTPGVSLRDIQDHLLRNVPGLEEHGISVHTVARLMNPPRQHTIARKQYKD